MDEEYVLGADVTTRFRPKKKTNTALVSVRLTAEDLALLERIATRRECSMSDVVRAALRAYEPQSAIPSNTITGMMAPSWWRLIP